MCRTAPGRRRLTTNVGFVLRREGVTQILQGAVQQAGYLHLGQPQLRPDLALGFVAVKPLQDNGAFAFWQPVEQLVQRVQVDHSIKIGIRFAEGVRQGGPVIARCGPVQGQAGISVRCGRGVADFVFVHPQLNGQLVGGRGGDAGLDEFTRALP